MYTWGYVKDAILAKLDLDEKEAAAQNLLSRFPFYANEVITQVCSAIKPKHTYLNVVTDHQYDLITMPEDFISFGADVNTIIEDGILRTCHDDDLVYKGYNQILLNYVGVYSISYNARWITFTKDMDNDVVLGIPADILDCIPSYIAHQCYKIDNEVKAAIFRNEYEMFLARIDDTHYMSSGDIKIGGDW